MKQLYALAFLSCISVAPLAAQVERYIAFPDSSTQQTAHNHVVDVSGELYILSYTNQFTRKSQQGIEGPGIDGRRLLKLGTAGELRWQRSYNTTRDPALPAGVRTNDPIPDPTIPPNPLLLAANGSLLVPHVTYTAGRDAAVKRLASLVVDPATGLTEVTVFRDSNCCVHYNLQASSYHNSQLSSIFRRDRTLNDSRQRLYLDRRNPNAATPLMFREVDSNWYSGSGIASFYDAGRHEFMLVNYSPWLKIVSAETGDGRSIRLFDSSTHYFNAYRIVAGPDHYVLNCSLTSKNGKGGGEYLIVYDRNWQELSRMPSSRLADVELTEDNTIWTLKNDLNSAPGQSPVVVTQYDLQLRPLRQLRIGRDRSSGRKLSIFGGRELIVSGNWAPGAAGTPDEGPNHTFIYRQDLRDIPGASAKLCEHFSVRPNPATERIRVETIPQNPSQTMQLSIWNSVGQIVHSSEFRTTQELELARLGGGIYFVQVFNPATQERCMSRLVRR